MTRSENQNSPPVRFSPFTLEKNPDRLKRGSELIKLRPKTLKVLRYLVERRGQIASKKELLNQVWEGRAVSDSVLRHCVREIRTALGDDASSPKFLESITGKGYRFLEGRDGRAIFPNVDGPVVGRDAELNLLEDHFQSATRGVAKFIVVSGEPGIGKTTLANRFIESAKQHATAKVIEAQCAVHYGKGEAYGPLLQAFSEQSQGEKGKIIVGLLRRFAPSWLLQLPGLISPAEAEGLHKQVDSASPEKMKREVLQLLEQLAEQSPLVIVIEDLHRADLSTIELLGFIAQSCKTRVFVLATYQPVDEVLYYQHLRELISTLRSHDLCEELFLKLLTIDQVSHYLQGRLEGPVEGAFAEKITQHSLGNPLFLIHILEELIQRQLILQEEGAWTTHSETDEFFGNLPGSLRSLISRRLNALPDNQNLILETASVIGLNFNIAAISGAIKPKMREVDKECRVMGKSGLFIEAASAEKLPNGMKTGTYRFQHPIYTEILYDQISDPRKALINLAVAEHLEALYGDQVDQIAPALAVNFERGLDIYRALHYRILSANQAANRHAYPETIVQLSHALQLLGQTPESPERDQQELKILVMLGPTQIASQGYASLEVAYTYDRAQQLLEDKTQNPQHIPILWNLASYHMVRAELSQSTSLINQVVELAENEDDSGLKIMAQDAQAQQLFFEGNFEDAKASIQYTLDWYDFSQHNGLAMEYGQEDPGVACYSLDAVIQVLSGSTHRALEQLESAKSLAKKLDNPHSTAFYFIWASLVSQFLRKPSEVQEQAKKIISIAEDYSIQWTPFAYAQEAWANGALQKDRECLKQIDFGLELWRTAGATIATPYFLYLRADLALTLEETGQAQVSLEEAISIVEKTQECWIEPEIHRLLGVTFLKQNKIDDAVERFYRALQFARVQKSRLFELRAAMNLSELMMQQGNPQGARALLEPVVISHANYKDLQGIDRASDLLQSLS